MESVAGRAASWTGPALFSVGFRPCFVFGARWAALAMGVWIAKLSGAAAPPIRIDPVSWHAHEFLFGYLGAAIAGFVLTATPTWTKRAPIAGPLLIGLFGLWLLGRVAMATSAWWPVAAVLAIDLAFPIAIAGVMAREIISARFWRGAPLIVLLTVFVIANARFHIEAIAGDYAASGYGIRAGLAVTLMLIAMIGGKTIPTFTRNWLRQRGDTVEPPEPMRPYDIAAIIALLASLLGWVFAPDAEATFWMLGAAGALHMIRLARWRGDRALREPLLWALHLGYAFLPLGALVAASGLWFDAVFVGAAAQHLWMAGGIGLMTLAIMTRVSRGHSGRPLTADGFTTALYVAIVLSVAARFAAGLWADAQDALYALSAAAWIFAFAGFAARHAPMAWRPRVAP
ncbi:MAG: NnrS family protein [Pseudomonadota bacterium]